MYGSVIDGIHQSASHHCERNPYLSRYKYKSRLIFHVCPIPDMAIWYDLKICRVALLENSIAICLRKAEDDIYFVARHRGISTKGMKNMLSGLS